MAIVDQVPEHMLMLFVVLVAEMEMKHVILAALPRYMVVQDAEMDVLRSKAMTVPLQVQRQELSK